MPNQRRLCVFLSLRDSHVNKLWSKIIKSINQRTFIVHHGSVRQFKQIHSHNLGSGVIGIKDFTRWMRYVRNIQRTRRSHIPPNHAIIYHFAECHKGGIIVFGGWSRKTNSSVWVTCGTHYKWVLITPYEYDCP